MFIIRNLTKTVGEGTEVLSKLSMQADKGDFITIVGASGSGKSLLLQCLSLEQNWDQGQYIYESRDITKLGFVDKLKLRKDWAILPETPDVNVNQTALRNVLAGRFFKISPWRHLTYTISPDEHMLGMDYLEKVGLLDKAQEKVQKLSGGERQRVAIAKALAKGAKVIFADEPIKGLQPEAANRVMEDIRNICRNQEVTVFCAVSNLELAERYATRIWGLAEGRVAVDIAARRLTQREKDIIFR